MDDTTTAPAGNASDDKFKAGQLAKLLAVHVLLADPESLGNDALEGDL